MASKPGLLGWFVSNPIAANLLMVVLVIGGLYNMPGLDKQFFPTPVIDRISISMPFPGASPREVEEQVCVRIEEAIHDLDGIKEIRSTASEGMGQVIVEALTGYPTQRLTNEIKRESTRSRPFLLTLRGRLSQNLSTGISSVSCNWRVSSTSGNSKSWVRP